MGLTTRQWLMQRFVDSLNWLKGNNVKTLKRFRLLVLSQVSCPYSEMNLNKEGLLPDRLSGERPLTLSGPPPRGRRPDPATNTTPQPASTPEQTEAAAEESQNRSAAEHSQGHAVKNTPSLPRLLFNGLCMQLCPTSVICVARKPELVEPERLGCSNPPEPTGGASEQSQNGTRPKRYQQSLSHSDMNGTMEVFISHIAKHIHKILSTVRTTLHHL